MKHSCIHMQSKSTLCFLIWTCCSGVIFKHCSLIRLPNKIPADWLPLATGWVTAFYYGYRAGKRQAQNLRIFLPRKYSCDFINPREIQISIRPLLLGKPGSPILNAENWTKSKIQTDFPLLSECFSKVTNAFGSTTKRLFFYLLP